MRDLRSPECVRVLRALGYAVDGSTPIRVVLSREGRKVFVPRHGPLTADELRAILLVARVAEEDFQRVRRELSAVRESGIREVPRQTASSGSGGRAGLWVGLSRMLGSVGLRRAG